jgi:hypothetical protein
VAWLNGYKALIVVTALSLAGCSAGGASIPSTSNAQDQARSAKELIGGGPGFYAAIAGVSIAASGASGRVVNAAGQPVVNASVKAESVDGVTAAKAVTAADGSFSLALAAGTYTLVVRNSYTSGGVTVNATGADAGASPKAQVVVAAGVVVSVGSLID